VDAFEHRSREAFDLILDIFPATHVFKADFIFQQSLH
jgi:hypothetical protein